MAFPSSAIGDCSVETQQGLLDYGLGEDTITSLCNEGCKSVQDCVNMYLLASVDVGAGAVVGLDTAFLLFSGYLVFVMQLGFAVLCAGSIRSKNCMNILLKNILDACVGAIGFYLFGYAFAYGRKPGTDANGFIGNWNFALSYTTEQSFAADGNFAGAGWQQFFFQWSFCAAATTIVSGAVAERCTFGAYVAYAFFLSSFVYPVVVHWVWASDGWLSAFNTSDGGYAKILKTGAIDFAGSGVVHMTGGIAALCGAAIIGPRVGRFESNGAVNEMKGHSAVLVVMGTFLLWFGWFGFNPGSNLVIGSRVAAEIVSRVAVCTALGGGAGGFTMLVWKWLRTRAWDVVAVCNGILAGLVAVTAGCAVIEPWAAIIAGAVGALVFCGADYLTLHVAKVDDPVSAFPLHGAYGSYGFGSTVDEGHRLRHLVLLSQFIEVLVITAWVGALVGVFFFIVHKAGMLRVSTEEELAGLDVINYASIKNGKQYKGDSSNHSGSDGVAANIQADEDTGTPHKGM